METPKLPRVRNFIYSQPWAIIPEWLDLFCEIVERHAGEKNAIESYQGAVRTVQGWAEYEVRNGIAILPIQGPIFPKSNMMTDYSGSTSLEEFISAFRGALGDSKVQGLFIKCDSPGGSVIGLSEAASAIYSARMNQMKPIKGHIEGMGCSAAYMLVSQCGEVTCTEGSMVGAIGTIMRLDSMDRMLKNEGVDSTILRSNELKAPGVGPMTPRQEDSMRKILNTYFEQFKSAVTRGRDGTGIDMAKASTGEVWIGNGKKYGIWAKETRNEVRFKCCQLALAFTPIVAVRMAYRTCTLLTGDFIRAGLEKAENEWQLTSQECSIDPKKPLPSYSLIVAKHALWQLAKNVAKIVTYPIALIGLVFASLYGIIDPLNGRFLIAAIEHAWSRDTIEHPSTKACFAYDRFYFGEYFPVCMQPGEVFDQKNIYRASPHHDPKSLQNKLLY